MRWFVLLLCVGGSVVLGEARTVTLSDAPIQVALQPLQPTALTLPEPITAIPTGADPTTLSLEALGPHLFLQALGPQVQGRLFVVGASGRVYTVQFAVRDKADAQVVVQAPAVPPAPTSVTGAHAGVDAEGVSALLRLMRTGSRPLPPGLTVSADAQVLRDDGRRHLVTTQVYTSPAWRGYVATLRNPTDRPHTLALSRFTAPGLLALSADTLTVPPHGTTRLYLVFGRD